MRIMAYVALLVALAASISAAAESQVYIRGNSGKWQQVPAKQNGATVTVNLGVEQLGGGRAEVVVGKPKWMVLDDAEAPKLAWVKLGANELGTTLSLELGVIGSFPATISFGLKDNANPLDPASVSLAFSDSHRTIKPDLSQVGFPKTSGRVSFTLPSLPAGRYHAVLQVADASPAGNRLDLPVSFSVIGFDVSPDRQTITAGTSGGAFTFKASPHETIRIGNAAAAYLTANVQGQHMYLEKITEVQTLCDTPELKSLRVVGIPGKTDKGGEGATLCRLEYDLSLRPELPCLLVTSRIVNLGPPGGMYCWWGWLPGTGYVDHTGDHQWAMAYKSIGKVGWVFLPSGKPEVDSIGWLSPLDFGESRFGTMLLYTDPRTIPDVKTGAAIELPFALVAAGSAEEVRILAEKLKALKPW